MNAQKITISYAPTEPTKFVYILRIYWESVELKKELSHQTVHSNIASLLKFHFDNLDYKRWDNGGRIYFIPANEQRVQNLSESEQTFAKQPVTRVEVESTPLYT
tara:strand:+ start:907 stop:1218 length:312 start_codon:yes stop_codon:yes gene_type:complete